MTKEIGLRNQSVLITGAAMGIGLATAKRLAASGFKVYVTCRASSDTRLLDKAIQASSQRLAKLTLDLGDSVSVHNGLKEILKNDERLDIVINNACDVVFGTIESCTLEQQRQSMNVNYFGVVRVLKEVLPFMRRRQRGQIINLSSVAGIDPYPPLETYSATKFALEGLTESLATNLRPWGIKCSLIEPGGVKTTAPEKAQLGNQGLPEDPFGRYAQASQKLMIQNYQKGAQEPEEIAELILSVLESPNPHLRYQTGAFSVQAAKKRFHDPTGDSFVEAKRRVLEENGLYQLIDR
jgi:NAD(P)-dependent dehydrogenase (short-subunit alcohol dehydrogenase family)